MQEFTGEIHPLASDYPMVGADELADLADSIKQQGQLDPITLTPDGVLLDGRNRLAACEMAGVPPKFEVYDGDPIAFIVGKNATRRQLSSGQRAMAIAIGMWESGAWDADAGSWRQGKARDAAKALLNSKSARLTVDLANCGTILAHSRDDARSVLAGESLQAVYKRVRESQKATQERADQMDTLRDKAPDLWRLVTEDGMALEEAWSAYLTRTEKERLQQEADAERIRKNNFHLRQNVHSIAQYSNPERRADRVAEWDSWGEKGAQAVTPALLKQAGEALIDLSKEWKKP